jgi:hypothetical protein
MAVTPNFWIRRPYLVYGMSMVLHLEGVNLVTGTNVETAKLFFAKVSPLAEWKLDTKFHNKIPNHVVRGGIAYETKDTPQKLLKDLEEADCYRSGGYPRSLCLILT